MISNKPILNLKPWLIEKTLLMKKLEPKLSLHLLKFQILTKKLGKMQKSIETGLKVNIKVLLIILHGLKQELPKLKENQLN